jgi:hypothetical protein
MIADSRQHIADSRLQTADSTVAVDGWEAQRRVRGLKSPLPHQHHSAPTLVGVARGDERGSELSQALCVGRRVLRKGDTRFRVFHRVGGRLVVAEILRRPGCVSFQQLLVFVRLPLVALDRLARRPASLLVLRVGRFGIL